MTTREMQQQLEGMGLSLRQEEYASTDKFGRLVGRKRWAAHVTKTGELFCRGMNPREAHGRALGKLGNRRHVTEP